MKSLDLASGAKNLKEIDGSFLDLKKGNRVSRALSFFDAKAL